jgi:hypothetical protein
VHTFKDLSPEVRCLVDSSALAVILAAFISSAGLVLAALIARAPARKQHHHEQALFEPAGLAGQEARNRSGPGARHTSAVDGDVSGQ